MSNESSRLTDTVMNELTDLSQTVSSDVALRSKTKKTLADLITALEKGETDVAARLLGAKGQLLAELYPQCKPTLEKLRFDLNRRQEEAIRETYRLLEEYCRSEGVALRGNAPRFTVEYFVELELDRVKGRTRVGTQSVNGVGWDGIRVALESERSRVWRRPFEAAAFRDRLLAAYEESERINPSPSGWTPLETIYQYLKRQAELDQPNWMKSGRLVAYYKDEFSADLSLLWQAQSRGQTASPQIEFSAIRDPRRAYKVLQPDQTVGTYGFMRAREVR